MIQQVVRKYLHRLKFRATGIGLDLAHLCLQHDDKEMANTPACQVVNNHNEEQQVLEKLTRLYREAGAEEEGKATEQRGNAGCASQPMFSQLRYEGNRLNSSLIQILTL